jgi:hypothetical protein
LRKSWRISPDTELVARYRIRAILGAPGSQVIGFDLDVWVTALQYDQRNVRKSLEQLKHHGIQNERGAETIETIVRIFAGHDLSHFRQIERILGANKK